MDFGLLQTVGVDEREVLARFMGNADLYCRILKKFLEDQSYQELKISWEDKDYDMAFRAAHTLKGVSANLGLGQIRELSSVITEQLRPGHTRDDLLLQSKMAELSQQYEETQKVIEQL